MFGRDRIWPTAAWISAMIIAAQIVLGWHGVAVIVLLIIVLVGLVDFIVSIREKRRS